MRCGVYTVLNESQHTDQQAGSFDPSTLLRGETFGGLGTYRTY